MGLPRPRGYTRVVRWFGCSQNGFPLTSGYTVSEHGQEPLRIVLRVRADTLGDFRLIKRQFGVHPRSRGYLP
jgi:hypothetical protein